MKHRSWLHYTWEVLLGLALAGILVVAMSGRAADEDEFLRDAVQSDQGLQELGGRLQGVTREMELSNVFNPDEMARGQRLSTGIVDLRHQEMQTILLALEKSIREVQSRTNSLRTATAGHRRAAERLSTLASLLAPTAADALLQALLEKLRALAADVTPLAEQVDKGQSLKPEQKVASDIYGDQAHSIAKEVPPPEISRRVDKAGDFLAARDPVNGKRELDAAIRALQDLINAKSEALAYAKAKEQELKALVEDLHKAEDAAKEIAKTADPNKAADRAMDALVRESDIKNRLDTMTQMEASADVAQAMADMQQSQPSAAAQKLDDAQKAVEAAAQALDAQIAQASQDQMNALASGQPQPPGPPDPNAPSSLPAPPQDNPYKREENQAAGSDPLKVRYTEKIWQAKLPERERQALLSARKEPYPPQMEQDVKKYYELLTE